MMIGMEGFETGLITVIQPREDGFARYFEMQVVAGIGNDLTTGIDDSGGDKRKVGTIGPDDLPVRL
jgi:hypothetical protein